MSLTEQRTTEMKPRAAAGWSTASLQSLMDHIVSTHHEYLKLEMPRIAAKTERLVKSQVEKHGDSSLVPLLDTFFELKNELESHLWKEEVVLFPLILSIESAAAAGIQALPAHCGSVNNPIRVMELEHSAAERALGEMQRITDNYGVPDGASETFRTLFAALKAFDADLREHIRLENEILHPRASELEARTF